MKAERFVGRPNLRALCGACSVSLPRGDAVQPLPEDKLQTLHRSLQLSFLSRFRESIMRPVDHTIVNYSRDTRRNTFRLATPAPS